MKLNDYKEAIIYFNNSLEEYPLFHKAKVNRAKCYFHEEDFENALKDYDELKSVDENLVPNQ